MSGAALLLRQPVVAGLYPNSPGNLAIANWSSQGGGGVEFANPSAGVLRVTRASGTATRPFLRFDGPSMQNVLVRARVEHTWITATDQTRFGPGVRKTGTAGVPAEQNYLYLGPRRLTTNAFNFQPKRVEAGGDSTEGTSANAPSMISVAVDIEMSAIGTSITWRWKLATDTAWTAGTPYTTSLVAAAGSLGIGCGGYPTGFTCDVTGFHYEVL